jgi:hypothetical protein
MGDRKNGIAFFNLYSDFSRFNHGYTALMPEGTQCNYILKNNDN